jgi:hypothetical protein
MSLCTCLFLPLVDNKNINNNHFENTNKQTNEMEKLVRRVFIMALGGATGMAVSMNPRFEESRRDMVKKYQQALITSKV